jgi:hypothetical protein
VNAPNAWERGAALPGEIMNKRATTHYFWTVLSGISALLCLLAGGDARAQGILPGAPSLTNRINVAPYVAVLKTNSQELEGWTPAVGFTAEATLFTNANCLLCPQEIGAGTAFLATNARMRVQDSVWLSAYWFVYGDVGYVGAQLGHTSFTASRVGANDTTVILTADGARGALAFGLQPHVNWYVELAFAARYFPVPSAVAAPLSSDPFWAYSGGINIGGTFGETLAEARKRKLKEQEKLKKE